MQFYEAEERFRKLEDQRRRGTISPDQYRAELNQLRVTGPQGRLWMPQEGTGQWYVWQGEQWFRAEPPHPVPAAPPPTAGGHEVPLRGGTGLVPSAREKEGGGKTGLYLAMWGVAWIVISMVVYTFWGRDEPMALAGIGLAAVISLVLMMSQLASQWSGQITDVRVERVNIDQGEGSIHTEDRWYAYVHRDNGKRKKVPADPHWKIGDRLEKRRGEPEVRHYPGRSTA